MTEIPASIVVKLRKISGQGMMDCKMALQEANGDMDKAVQILRKKGLATLAKRAERETSQGLVVGKSSDNGKISAMATLCCETDFVARSSDFIAAAGALADFALACPAEEGIDNILETTLNGRKLRDIVTEVVSKTGEKIQVGDYTRYKLDGSGLISTYIHFNGKVGTMVQIETSSDNVAAADVLRRTAADLAMHITATKPLALDKNALKPEIIEQEKTVYREQIKDKPANMIDKIIEGKMKKFYTENCLLDQLFVKDDSKTVAQVLAEAAKQAGGEAKIKRFVRFDVG
ncbi:MAG: translation elongation factor Ts [Planctomycetes bacterium RBG_13_46_10]|nr:MAG: translation elongation factor Ts [Planctomycetes bacterium RBG_13_46_10]